MIDDSGSRMSLCKNLDTPVCNVTSNNLQRQHFWRLSTDEARETLRGMKRLYKFHLCLLTHTHCTCSQSGQDHHVPHVQLRVDVHGCPTTLPVRSLIVSTQYMADWRWSTPTDSSDVPKVHEKSKERSSRNLSLPPPSASICPGKKMCAGSLRLVLPVAPTHSDTCLLVGLGSQTDVSSVFFIEQPHTDVKKGRDFPQEDHARQLSGRGCLAGHRHHHRPKR